MHKFVMGWGADESQTHDHQFVMTLQKIGMVQQKIVSHFKRLT